MSEIDKFEVSGVYSISGNLCLDVDNIVSYVTNANKMSLS